MPPLCIDSLFSGGLIVNYVCSSACAHCVYRSSPQRARGYITREQATANLRAVRRLGCRSVHLGGGEPLLDPAGLKEVLRVAQTERVGIDYIETNASWVRDEGATVGLLRELQSLGCDTLLISMDPFHTAFIPFHKVKGLVAACRRAGTEVFPWRLEFYEEINRLDDRRTHTLDEFERAYGPGYLESLRRRYGVSLGGRALRTFCPGLPSRPLAEVLAEGSRPCQDLANGSHFHVDLFGDFIPTRCPGLAIAIADLGRPLDPRRYPALDTLYSHGPTGLYERALEVGFQARRDYALPCELCDHVRTFLATHAPERFPDLRPLEFYTVDAAEEARPGLAAAPPTGSTGPRT